MEANGETQEIPAKEDRKIVRKFSKCARSALTPNTEEMEKLEQSVQGGRLIQLHYLYGGTANAEINRFSASDQRRITGKLWEPLPLRLVWR